MVPLLVGDGVPGAGAILWTVGKALLFFVRWNLKRAEARVMQHVPSVGICVRNAVHFNIGDLWKKTLLADTNPPQPNRTHRIDAEELGVDRGSARLVLPAPSAAAAQVQERGSSLPKEA